MKRRIFGLFAAMLMLLGASAAHAGEKARMTVFVSPRCQDCARAEEKVLPAIEKEFADKVAFEYKDLSDNENYKLLLGLRAKYSKDLPIVLPVFFLEGRMINGSGDLKQNLEKFIVAALQNPVRVEEGQEADLASHFREFRSVAIIGAGLIDGINPCAFTVIVFFMSFLALQGYRKRELIPIGLSFILTVFCTYILIGLGIFNFLYRIKGFWLATRAINMAIGIFSILLGFLAVADALIFRRTGEAENLFLQLPRPIKNQIHKIIGLHYRRDKGERGGSAPALKLVAGTFVTGFLVSLLEALCTGQLYLPTITYMLKASPYKVQALGYLLLYNLMFIAPLFAIFLLTLAGATSAQFSAFIKRNMVGVKILLAGMFFLLGGLLILRF